MSARFIKIVDSTNPLIHYSSADGYDLNAIEALQDCIGIIQEETAWGFGEVFCTNWAMYFTYEIQQ